MVALILKIGISQNANYGNMVNFPKSGHIKTGGIMKQVIVITPDEVVYNFRTGPNGPDRTESIKFGLDRTRLLSAHAL